MLTLYKRHTKGCAEGRQQGGAHESIAQLRADRGHRRCACPIHAEGTLRIDGFVRKATAENKWAKAEERKKNWEDAGTLNVGPSQPTSPAPQEAPRIEHVIEEFSKDRAACGLAGGTLKKYRQFTD